MKISSYLGLVSVLAVPVAMADQAVQFPKKAPLIDMAFPDKWEVKPKQGVVYAHPQGDASYFMALSLMEATSEDPEAAMLEAKTGIEELFKNVRYSEPEMIEAGELDVMLVNAKGKDEDGVANINLWLIATVIPICRWQGQGFGWLGIVEASFGGLRPMKGCCSRSTT